MHSNHVFKTILVGDNGSPESERAVDVAVSLASTLKAKIVVLGVLTPPSAESQAEGYGLDSADKTRTMLEAKFSLLREAAQRDQIDMVTDIVKGDADEAIERRAEEDRADLIVVGRRDITRLRRWLEGSTSEGLVRHSKTSVLVVCD